MESIQSISIHKVFNLMERINHTRQIIWHESCKCICRLTKSICDSRQILNKNKCTCECREELIDKECDRSCCIGEYLDYKTCVSRNTLIDKLVEECTSVIDENKVYNETLNTISSNGCLSCTLYVALFAVFLTTGVIIGIAFIYFLWYKKK